MNQLDDPKTVLFSNIITKPEHYIGKELVFINKEPEPEYRLARIICIYPKPFGSIDSMVIVSDGNTADQYCLEDFQRARTQK